MLKLPSAKSKTPLKQLLSEKACRDFDKSKQISLKNFAYIIESVFKAKEFKLSNDLEVVRKNSPAGGSIHSVEPYFFISRVEGTEIGIYHYLSLDHALEKLPIKLENEDIDKLMQEVVAHPDDFNGVAALCIMTTRFDRKLWKYRNHAKALRICNMDAGHLSQTFI